MLSAIGDARGGRRYGHRHPTVRNCQVSVKDRHHRMFANFANDPARSYRANETAPEKETVVASEAMRIQPSAVQSDLCSRRRNKCACPCP